jgi:transposase
LRVPLVRVLIAIKLFELDASVREAAHQLDLSYNTVYDLFCLFRQSIVRTDRDTSFTLSGEIEMDESYFCGRRKGETEVGELQES